MKHLQVALRFLGATALGVSAIVCQNPVPTRVQVQIYGAASGTPSPVELRIDIDATGPERTLVRIANGQPQELAALLLGTEPTEVSLAHGAQLLVVPMVAILGAFDGRGNFAISIDIANPAFIGVSLFAQGFCYVQPEPYPEVFQLSNGLRTAFFSGNEQPPLAYAGPPLTTTLIAKGDPKFDTSHELLCSILTPTSAWNLRLQGTQTDSGVTAVYLILEAPNPEEIVLPVLSPLRLLVDLGFAAAPRIEVSIERRTRGMQAPPAFALGAAIDRDF